MLPYLVGLTTLGSVRPYFRKHVYATLEPIDFMFVNAALIAIMSSILARSNKPMRTAAC